MKIWPRLKKSSEKPNETSASRSSVCHERIRRRSTSPRTKTSAERDPHPPGVEDLAAERADPPARHAPTRPAGRSTPRRPSRRRPRPCRRRSPRPCRTRPSPSIAGSPGRTSRRSVASADIARATAPPSDRQGSVAIAASSVSRDRRGCWSERLLDGPALAARASDRSGRIGCAGGRREQQRERHATRQPPHRRKDQSLLPMKLSGVTRTIAAACAGIAPTPILTST